MSKQLTIRDVDEQLAERLRHEAQRRGLSVNRTVLQLLRQALGTPPASAAARTLAAIAALPMEDEGPGFSGREHDRALYGQR